MGLFLMSCKSSYWPSVCLPSPQLPATPWSHQGGGDWVRLSRGAIRPPAPGERMRRHESCMAAGEGTMGRNLVFLVTNKPILTLLEAERLFHTILSLVLLGHKLLEGSI